MLCALCLFAGVVDAQHSARPTERNIPYARESDRFRMLDLYLPDDAEETDLPYPVVLMFHGSPGAKGDFANYGAPQVIPLGYAAVAVEYVTDFPNAYNDAFCALAWVYANAETYNLDPQRVALFGVSFGGLVAAAVGAIDDPSAFLSDCQNTLPDEYALSGVGRRGRGLQCKR